MGQRIKRMRQRIKRMQRINEKTDIYILLVEKQKGKIINII